MALIILIISAIIALFFVIYHWKLSNQAQHLLHSETLIIDDKLKFLSGDIIALFDVHAHFKTKWVSKPKHFGWPTWQKLY